MEEDPKKTVKLSEEVETQPLTFTEVEPAIQQKLAKLIKKNKISQAEQLILPFFHPNGKIEGKQKKGGHIYPEVPPHPKNAYLLEFAKLSCTNKHAKRGAQFIKKLFSTKAKTKVEDFEKFLGEFFPDLETRLRKKSIRFMIGNCDWEMIELRLRQNKRLLGLACEDMFFKEELDIVNRWVSVYGLQSARIDKENGVLIKVEICDYVENELPKIENLKIIKNRLIEEDEFGKEKMKQR